jgi:hypothetical protein
MGSTVNDYPRERTATTTHEQFCKGCNLTTVHRTYMTGYRGRVQVIKVCLGCGYSEGRVA